jgi:hypothetical protein
MGLVALALAGFVVFLFVAASAATRRPALPGRDRRDAFFAWSKQLDAGSSELRGDAWRLSFTLDGVPARALVSVDIDARSSPDSWRVQHATLTVEASSPNGASVSTRPDRAPHPLLEAVGVGRDLRLTGDDHDLLALCTGPLLLAMSRSISGDWTHASLGEVFRFERDGAGSVEQLVSAFPEMLDLARECVEAIPEGSTPELLVARALSSADHERVRWRAARAVLELPGATASKRRLLSHLDTLPRSVQAACALWREDADMDDASYATIVEGRGLNDDDLTEAIDHALTTRAPWRALFDTRLPWSVRAACAPGALAHAPSDPDGALVDLLVRPLPSGANRPVLLRTLRASGWDPAPEPLATLARDAVGSVRHELVRDLQSREVTAADAPMLAALAARGHGGDVEPLLRDLRDRGGLTAGQLSLAGDPVTSGALTASRGAGDLTISSEEEPEP